MFTRWQEEKVRHLLTIRRGVHLTGARQVGKTTLVRMLQLPHLRYWTFDDPSLRQAASLDPMGFILQTKAQVIALDEVQKVPVLLDALKMRLDQESQTGQFLLTGSANFQGNKKIHESLAGRLGLVRLRTLSLGEINGSKPDFLAGAFEREFASSPKPLSKREIIHCAFMGGYPEPLSFSLKDRSEWIRSYLADIILKDIQDLTEIRKVSVLHALAQWLFAHSTRFFSMEELSAKMGLAKVTLETYLEALRALYLVDKIHAFSKSDYDGLGKRSKWVVSDVSLMAHALQWDEETAYFNEHQSGQLIETWVYQQLVTQVELDHTYTVTHYRDGRKREIDFMVERSDGAYLGVEVKASSYVCAADFKHLKWFGANLAQKNFTGIVFYSGEHVLPFGEGYYALPLGLLA